MLIGLKYLLCGVTYGIIHFNSSEVYALPGDVKTRMPRSSQQDADLPSWRRSARSAIQEEPSRKDNYFDVMDDSSIVPNDMPLNVIGLEPDLHYSNAASLHRVQEAPVDISRSRTQAKEREPHIPQFMLDLFDRFDQDKSMQPTSKIIRSFPNKATKIQQRQFNHAFLACVRDLDHICLNKRLLIFDVSSIPLHEELSRAELRLHRVVRNFGNAPSNGIHISIKIVERNCLRLKMHRTRSRTEDFCKPGYFSVFPDRARVIDSRNLVVHREGWETFEITGLLQGWMRRRRPRQIEVHITAADLTNGEVDIEIQPSSPNEPLLVVFFEDTRKNRHFEHVREMREMSHQFGLQQTSDAVQVNPEGVHKRNKRSMLNAAHDVEIDGIRVPVSSTKEQNNKRISQENLQRTRRSAKLNGRCHRQEMRVDISKIKLNYIHRPRQYEAYKCVGECTLPLTGHATKHATIQAAVKHYFPDIHGPPCCVPTKLGPISLLYYVEPPGVIEYKYEYDDMQVLECGCR